MIASERRPLLIEFWTTWCAPCRAIRFHLDQMAATDHPGWRFVAVNSEHHPDVAERFGVRAHPTLAFYKGGVEVGRIAGKTLVSEVSAKLEELSA